MQAEHHRPDLDAAHAALEVERVGERDARVGERRDVRQQRAGVDVDGVAAGRLDDRHAGRDQLVAEVLGGADAVAQVLLVDDLLEPARDRLEVVAGQPAVGGEALGQDQQVPRLLGPRRRRSSRGSRRCWRGRPSWPTSCSRRPARTSRARCRVGRPLGLARPRALDEPRVLGEAAGVEEERLAVPVAERAHAAQVLERHRLAAAGVVGHRHHDQRHAVALASSSRRSSAPRSMLPLNGWIERRHAAFGDHQVARLGALDLDVGARRVEVVVVRHDVARAARTVWNRMRSAARPWCVGMMCRKPVRSRDDVAEAVERPAAGVRLVALHQRAPLRRRHRAGARVGEQVDQDVVGVQQEDVVAGGSRARASRSSGVVNLMASTDLMRNGSMMVRMCTCKSDVE